jgi:predicted metalloenzyme YecM
LGKLNDISVTGIGIEVIALPEVINENFASGSWVYVSLNLPVSGKDVERPLTLPGTIRYTGSYHENHSLGIQISPDKETEALINAYIAHRHTEILSEVEQYSDNYRSTNNTNNWWYPT